MTFKLINEAIGKYKDNDHMIELLSILVEKGIGRNIIEILDYINKTYREIKSFDRKNIPHIQKAIY